MSTKLMPGDGQTSSPVRRRLRKPGRPVRDTVRDGDLLPRECDASRQGDFVESPQSWLKAKMNGMQRQGYISRVP